MKNMHYLAKFAAGCFLFLLLSNAGYAAERHKWTNDEDYELTLLVQEHGTSWKVIASNFGNRTAKQCRERWINHAQPGIKKGPLTDEEFAVVLHAREIWNNRWSKIATLLPGRTPIQVKNSFHAQTRRDARKSKQLLKKAAVQDDKNPKKRGTVSFDEDEAMSEEEIERAAFELETMKLSLETYAIQVDNEDGDDESTDEDETREAINVLAQIATPFASKNHAPIEIDDESDEESIDEGAVTVLANMPISRGSL